MLQARAKTSSALPALGVLSYYFTAERTFGLCLVRKIQLTWNRLYLASVYQSHLACSNHLASSNVFSSSSCNFEGLNFQKWRIHGLAFRIAPRPYPMSTQGLSIVTRRTPYNENDFTESLSAFGIGGVPNCWMYALILKGHVSVCTFANPDQMLCSISEHPEHQTEQKGQDNRCKIFGDTASDHFSKPGNAQFIGDDSVVEARATTPYHKHR
jgi:hypothetical protein